MTVLTAGSEDLALVNVPAALAVSVQGIPFIAVTNSTLKSVE